MTIHFFTLSLPQKAGAAAMTAHHHRRHLNFSLLLLAVVILIQCVAAQHNNNKVGPLISSTERSALLNLRSTLGLRAKDWPLKTDPCNTWTGIQCRNGTVSSINVSGLKRTRLGRLNPQFNVDGLANLTRLLSFNASNFYLPGQIPVWLGSRLGSLEVLDLTSCSITGQIPDSFGNLTSLHSLYLADNHITGSIPDALMKLSSLSIVDLSKNRLNGSMPADFSLLKSVSVVKFGSNDLSGSIPASLGSVYGLQVLHLSNNSLTSSIPVEFGYLSSLVEFDVSKNLLSGALPVEFGGLKSLKVMNIADNELEGPLPRGLFTRLDQLEVVDFSRNRFDGAVPSALLLLPKLHALDLSMNNFTGTLPVVGSSTGDTSATLNISSNLLYGSLNASNWNYSVIDLSGNYIEGKSPVDSRSNAIVDRNCLQDAPNQRSFKECKKFYAARGLGFNYFAGRVPRQSPSPGAEPKSSRRWIYILAGILGGLGFIAILVVLLVLLLRKGVKGISNQKGCANVGPVPEGDLPKDLEIASILGQSYTYDQLLQSTGGFSDTNLIRHGHSGYLFRGVLESGAPIIVKKVDLSSFKKESYITELDVFSKVSHARLVTLLGQCLEHETEKFLVYKFMPNGDLGSSFFRVSSSEDDSLQSLDWITRLKIATGAAEVLAYLHHECTPPLVHRDVQASSILLDDKFEVRLGSLSEVCAQEGDPHHSVLTRFLRKPQMSEPGPSGLSSTTCAYDVYCFGKVLLELVTGKLGISKSDDATTREWVEQTLPYISVYDKEMVTKIVDPSLIVDEDLLEEVWAMAIVARSCLNPKPHKRPPMKYVLKALENPLKVVREESFSSGRLRTTSSRRSWSAAFFGSWRQNSLESSATLGHTSKEGISGLKHSGRTGSHGSSRIDLSSSRKRLSNEIFPDPVDIQDIEKTG